MNSLKLFAVTILLLLGAWAAAENDSIAVCGLFALGALVTGMRALVVNHHEHTR